MRPAAIVSRCFREREMFRPSPLVTSAFRGERYSAASIPPSNRPRMVGRWHGFPRSRRLGGPWLLLFLRGELGSCQWASICDSSCLKESPDTDRNAGVVNINSVW
jgi:hypothetical protein